MTDKGAITQAIEDFEACLVQIETRHFGATDTSKQGRKSLEALKAFKDGPAPFVRGLTLGSNLEGKISETDAIKLVNSVMASLWEIMMDKAEVVDNIDGDIETKHLQDAIK